MHFDYAAHSGHPWISVDGEAPDKPLDNAVLSRLKQFTAMNKLKKLALKVRFAAFHTFSVKCSLVEKIDS